MLTLIKSARILDPGNSDGTGNILIQDGRFQEIRLYEGDSPPEEFEGSVDRTIDAAGRLLVPGLIDMHVHLREPGHEYKETIRTGCMAAAHGGFTTVCCMPNTSPVNDNAQVTEYIGRQSALADSVRVLPVGAVSLGLSGDRLSEYGDLKSAGAVALSDDGNPVANSLLMRRAMEYAAGFGLFVISHCEDPALAGNGVMNEGETATRMGLAGIANAVETIMVMRDIALCEFTGIPVHIAHVSAKESVQAIRDAKKRGVLITAETAPHYFTLTEEAVAGYNTHAKMNPPLRTEQDRLAIIDGLADGTLDVIATDHAPHSSVEKELEFEKAANGIIGLETSLALGLNLVQNNQVALPVLIEKMSKNPARILGIDNSITVGNRADLTLIDLEAAWRVDASTFKSKSRNTPFDGWKVKGKAVMTMVGGRVVYEEMGEG
ncbi:MAG: dihydroorotase [Desulfobacterales bacterium]